ncbi:Crp/Fnr family transcriptional regulator [Mucilaginibacter sp. L3T2-6]|uniref:Crp/Fnr family transcriptional regulator n=1 Tax=Mucilaginibacter sp. L3T2-6 TaxID=3062491 RepID=UPI002675A867|nr:Crp/Fnr family transcriptional regulator [Mucilaginibacter sp. L3T2-6]MDO3642301.1 Crp/Fnr family transcriptional regulator [Mucilaginibacter sp. L3T2-6]MDV6214796.1 Crp/Fnr family transcriptional regulator [Mucilaginibacter sp. L3T2-6]
MTTENFIIYLSGITPLTPALIEELHRVLKVEYYRPHQVLFVSGQPENRICFFSAGFARSYYYDASGGEQTVRFYNASDILFSVEGYWGYAGYFYTEILEDTTLITLRYNELQWLQDRFKETALLTSTILNRFYSEEHEKQKLSYLTAEERFKEMRKKHRDVFQKAPLRMIASYLNMSRETLSRMIARS